MLATLTFIVLGTTLVLFFLQELTGACKKVINIPGVKFLGPLFLLTWLVEQYEYWLTECLLYYQETLRFLIHRSAQWFRWEEVMMPMMHILFLCLLANGLAWLMAGWSKVNDLADPWPYAHRVGVVLWSLSAMLLVIDF